MNHEPFEEAPNRLDPHDATPTPDDPTAAANLAEREELTQRQFADVTALRLVLQKAVRAKHLASNPFSDLDAVLPRRTDETTIDPFTGDEVRRLLEAAETIDSAWRRC